MLFGTLVELPGMSTIGSLERKDRFSRGDLSGDRCLNKGNNTLTVYNYNLIGDLRGNFTLVFINSCITQHGS